MIPYWEVMALKMGELDVDKSNVTNGVDIGKKIVVPIWSAAVYSGTHKIIIDTGISDVDWVVKKLGGCRRKKDESIAEAIKQRLGWSPEDIDTVINTHLHHDHCGDNRLFKKAVFIVQKAEFEAAIDSTCPQTLLYKKSQFNSNAVNYTDWKLIEGEYEVFPGVKVFPTPGHTKGHQSVFIKTKEGTLCFAGDAINTLENIEKNIPCGYMVNTIQTYTSMQNIRDRAKYIIPGHEASIEKYQERGFPIILGIEQKL